MPVPLAHESASNAGGSARSPPLGRQAGHARRGRARRTLHSSPRPWGAYPHRPPLSRRHCDTRRTSRLSRSGGREAGWLGMSQALGLSAPLRVHSPLPPAPPPGHQREGATSLKRLAAGISPRSAGPEASPRGLGVGGGGADAARRPAAAPAPASAGRLVAFCPRAHGKRGAGCACGGHSDPPPERSPEGPSASVGRGSARRPLPCAPRAFLSPLAAAGTRTARQRSEWAGTCSFAQGPEVT